MISIYLYICVTCSFMIGIVWAEQSDTGTRTVTGMFIQVAIAPFILPMVLGAITYQKTKGRYGR